MILNEEEQVLYVAFEDINRIFTYVLEDGQLPPDAATISGTSTSDYISLVIGNRFLYAASFGDTSIETYIIGPRGLLPETPEPQDPFTEVFRPNDMVVNGRVLYSITQSRERIEAFNIRPNGLLPEEYDSRTSSEQRYARLLLDGDRLYASGVGVGRIDLYIVNPDGSLPTGEPFAETEHDAAAFPIDIILDSGILYVAQSGLGRVDAYILSADGSPSRFPSSSTNEIPDSFPVGLALGSFPQ
jgi:6-phosphogluconolactonase (cycloisomerase 2 family)